MPRQRRPPNFSVPDRELLQLEQGVKNPSTAPHSRTQMNPFKARNRRPQTPKTAPVPKRLKTEPHSNMVPMPPPPPPSVPKHDSVQPEPEADFYDQTGRPYPRIIRLPERRYPGRGFKRYGIPLLLQKYEERNRERNPRGISAKAATKESADSPSNEFESMEGMTTSDEEEQHIDMDQEDVKLFKDLHLALKKAIIEGIEHDMRDQQPWRYPPRTDGEINHYASRTLLHIDSMHIDDIKNDRRVSTIKGSISPPTEEEVQTAKTFLKGKGLPIALIRPWFNCDTEE